MPCSKDEECELLPEIIPFAEDAKARLYMWQEEHAKLCDTEFNATLVGVYCKLEVYVIRFCLIIQMARWACSEVIRPKLTLFLWNEPSLLPSIFAIRHSKCTQRLSGIQLTQQQQQLLAETASILSDCRSPEYCRAIGDEREGF